MKIDSMDRIPISLLSNTSSATMDFHEYPESEIQVGDQDMILFQDENRAIMVAILRNRAAEQFRQENAQTPAVNNLQTLQTDSDIVLINDYLLITEKWQPDRADHDDESKLMTLSQGHNTLAGFVRRFLGMDIGETGTQDITVTSKDVVDGMARATRDLDEEKARGSETRCTGCGRLGVGTEKS